MENIIPRYKSVCPLTEEPGPCHRHSADGQSLAGGLPDHLDSVFFLKKVSVAEYRYRDGLLNKPDHIPLGRAGPSVRSNPRMEGQGISPGLFKPSGHINGR